MARMHLWVILVPDFGLLHRIPPSPLDGESGTMPLESYRGTEDSEERQVFIDSSLLEFLNRCSYQRMITTSSRTRPFIPYTPDTPTAMSTMLLCNLHSTGMVIIVMAYAFTITATTVYRHGEHDYESSESSRHRVRSHGCPDDLSRYYCVFAIQSYVIPRRLVTRKKECDFEMADKNIPSPW